MTASTLLTFRLFAERHPAFTEAALRNLRFHEKLNGFDGAFVRVGRRVLIDEGAFFSAIARQNQKVAA